MKDIKKDSSNNYKINNKNIRPLNSFSGVHTVKKRTKSIRKRKNYRHIFLTMNCQKKEKKSFFLQKFLKLFRVLLTLQLNRKQSLWDLYYILTQNMFRTHEGKQAFSEKKYPICDCPRSHSMPYTDQITEIAPLCPHLFLSYQLI